MALSCGGEAFVSSSLGSNYWVPIVVATGEIEMDVLKAVLSS